jgi:uncharacterized protein with NRDE domain
VCLILLAWRAREDLPLVVAANRDEWRERPTQPAHWWPDHPGIFAGRDERAGGTWMGFARGGRFAAVTNFRDPSDRRSTARSRGELVTDFLLSTESPGAFLAALHSRAGEYNGFNLLVGDGRSLWYYGSREGAAREMAPGIYGLSNHLLDEPWPKVVQGREAMTRALADGDPRPRLEAFLADASLAADDALPQTGVGADWERRLSAALITGADYGTRSSTTLLIDNRGRAQVRELTRDAEGRVTTTASFDDERTSHERTPPSPPPVDGRPPGRVRDGGPRGR